MSRGGVDAGRGHELVPDLDAGRGRIVELLDRAVESVLQIVGEGRQTDDVVEGLGRQARLVSQPTLGGLVLAINIAVYTIWLRRRRMRQDPLNG